MPLPERRLPTAVLLALAIGIGAFALSCLVERPLGHGFSFGLTYQQMSVDPLAFEGLFPHRVLLPLLANLLSLSGPSFHYAAHGSAALLLVLVALTAQRLGTNLLDTALLTLACALGGATQLYKSHVGYPDSLSFVLLLAAVLAVRHGPLAWGLLLLGAFAHEQVLFFAPFLVWLRCRVAGARPRGELGPLLAVVAVYALFRLAIHHDDGKAVAPHYYFGNGYFPLGFVGVLYLAMVQVVLVFGLQLPALTYAYRAGLQTPRAAQPHWQRPALWLYVAAIVGIYAVAHDFNRFVNFLFLPLLFGWRELLRRPGGRLLLVASLLAQVVVTRFVVMPVVQVFFAPMAECGCLTGVPSELQKLVTYVLPRVWPHVAGAAVLLGLLLAGGGWLARRQNRPAGAFEARGEALR
jgi:hypothetical protein